MQLKKFSVDLPKRLRGLKTEDGDRSTQGPKRHTVGSGLWQLGDADTARPVGCIRQRRP